MELFKTQKYMPKDRIKVKEDGRDIADNEEVNLFNYQKREILRQTQQTIESRQNNREEE